MLAGILKSTKVTEEKINQELLWFLKSSPTPFHAVENMSRILLQNGFKELWENDLWDLQEKGQYFVRRNDSSVVAFKTGKNEFLPQGLRMIGAHTDSPCLKIRPNADLVSCSYGQWGVEVYGGVLLSTWFDRDLSLAGKVVYLTKNGEMKKALLNFQKPLAVVPNLAIHLNREANENRSINKQKEMPPIICQWGPTLPSSHESKGSETFFHQLLLEGLEDLQEAAPGRKILSSEMYLYDTQAPAIVGYRDEFLTGARLDNLLSCYIGLRALLEAHDERGSLLVCNDHEEVGSASHIGAQGPFLKSVLERICAKGSHDLTRVMDNSMMISADNAHGVHPNYMERHDLNHAPLLNHGPVLKVNANQRYSTNCETGGLFTFLCQKADVPMQTFGARADMACGSTIGPITATVLGIKTVDVGIPTFAMHSIREMGGTRDTFYFYKVLREFYLQEKLSFDF